MAVELATGYISLVPSARNMGRNIARELNGPLTDAGRKAGDDASTAFGGRFSAGMKTAAKQAAVAIGVAFAAAGTYGVKVAADFQQTRIGFEGILGSAEEADKRLRELQAFAAKTPFQFAGLAESAQQLLAVGFSAEDIIPVMTTLGNVAATLGVGEAEIKGVVRALGQMKGKGKASAQELLQISEQIPGFSAIDAIAKDMGISVADAFKEMEKGAIPANRAIEAILNGMESFPGAAGAMERQSKTLNGVLSTFKDTLNIALIQGIEPFLPAISGALLGAIPIMERFVSGTIGGVASVVTGIGAMTGVIGDFWTEINRGDVGAGIAVAIGSIVGLAEDHGLVSALATALTAVGDAGAAAYEALSGVVGFVATEVSAAVDTAREAWHRYATEGVGPVADAFDRITTTIGDVNAALLEQKDILIPAAAAATTFAAAFVTYTQVSRGISAVTSAVSLLGPAVATALAPLLASPIGLVVAGVAAVAAAFAAAYFTVQPFRDAVDGVIDTIGDLAVRFGEFASDVFDRAIPALQDFAGEVVDIAGDIGDGISDALGTVGGLIQRNLIRPLRPLGSFLADDVAPAFGAFAEFLAAVFDRIGTVAGPVVQVVSSALEFLAGVASDIVGPVFDNLAATISAAIDIVSTVITTFAQVVAPVFATAFDAAAAGIDIAFGIITGIIDAFFRTVEGVFTALTGLVQGDFGKVWEGLTAIIGAPFGAIRDIVVNTFTEIVDFVGTLPGRIGDFIGAIFGGGIDIATSVFEGIASIVTTQFDGIVTFISELPGRIADAASGMWDGIAEGFEGVINFLIGAWNSLRFKLPEIDTHIPGIGKVGGFELGPTRMPLVNFAEGGIVTARPGGLIGRLGEAGRNEAVIPLPPNFDISDMRGGALVGGDLNVLQMPGEDSALTAMRELRRLQLLTA